MIIYLLILWMSLFFWVTRGYDVMVKKFGHMTMWTILFFFLLSSSVLFSIISVRYGFL